MELMYLFIKLIVGKRALLGLKHSKAKREQDHFGIRSVGQRSSEQIPIC